MKKFPAFLLILGLCLILSGQKPGQAADGDAMALRVEGKVTVIRSGTYYRVVEGDLFHEGDRVETEDGARVDIVQKGMAGIRLLESTKGTLARLRLGDIRMDVDQGNVIASVRRDDDPRVRISTPIAVAAVRGTQFWGQVVPQGDRVTFAVRQGSVRVTVKSNGMKYDLERGQAVDILLGEAGQRVREAAEAEMQAMEQAETIAV